ncbi:hypothetical protein PAXRUDRAFT_136697, partial [Paxillus rubicundulus Ve08.2h10]
IHHLEIAHKSIKTLSNLFEKPTTMKQSNVTPWETTSILTTAADNTPEVP